MTCKLQVANYQAISQLDSHITVVFSDDKSFAKPPLCEKKRSAFSKDLKQFLSVLQLNCQTDLDNKHNNQTFIMGSQLAAESKQERTIAQP